MNVTLSKLDKYSLFNIKILPTQIIKKNVRYIFVIDNSGSMGEFTKLLTDVVISGLTNHFNEKNDYINLFSSILISFSKCAQTLSRNITSKSDIDTINFDKQSATNITDAIKLACEEIINIDDVNDNCQNILIFISDGKHNFGAELEDEDIEHYKNIFYKNDIILSIINIGISDDCDTKLLTQIKLIETLEITTIDQFFHVKNHEEAQYVLKNLIELLNF